SVRQCSIHPLTVRRAMVTAYWLCVCVLVPACVKAGLYTSSDQVLLLSPDNVHTLLVNSSAAMVVEFYASWCGHCIAFSPVYKKLARDIKEWKPAVNLAALDCAAEENRKICIDYKIRGYPTVKFFHAYSKADAVGQEFKGVSRDVRDLRHKIIDKLETHSEPWPPACPPLEPTSQAEIDHFFETNSVHHLALIFEDFSSYIGREVTLDLLQFENIAVRRVLKTEDALVTKLGVTEFPSCYLYYPGGNFTKLHVQIEARTFYALALQKLPGVVRSGRPPAVPGDDLKNSTDESWKPFNSSRVYMADLESTLYYSLYVEVAAHTVISGEALTALKKYISVLSKHFPGRPVVMNLLKSVNSWLQSQTADQISYDALEDILDNTAQMPNAALPDDTKWVGCQGSQPHLRRYPCGLWTLFHVLTVQAKNSTASDPLEVLDAMKRYIHIFFGCRQCAEHFGNMVDSLVEVKTLSSAILWLWAKHNRVNNRIAGALSEDPQFPKIQWPSPEMCSACHTVTDNGEHRWNTEEVLAFLLTYFSSSRILTDYLESDRQMLEKQKDRNARYQRDLEAEKHVERKTREASDPGAHPLLSQPNEQEEEEEGEEEGEEEEEEEEEDEAVADGYEDGGEAAPAALSEMKGKPEPTPWIHPESLVGRSRRKAHRRPSIVGMRPRGQQEDIVDLDSFVNQHYKARAVELASSNRVKRRMLQRQKELEPQPVFRLGMELDAALGMVGLQPMEEDFDMDVRQRQEEGRSYRGSWISVLSIGFSKLDISLCVILYLLSFFFLLSMYLYFKKRLRLRRAKTTLT
uniref:Sulfhydryl oxidase n=1 Tax=Gouania willdenowi TaxID=441366 RepID=A0A8C5D3W5_GOUWI